MTTPPSPPYAPSRPRTKQFIPYGARSAANAVHPTCKGMLSFENNSDSPPPKKRSRREYTLKWLEARHRRTENTVRRMEGLKKSVYCLLDEVTELTLQALEERSKTELALTRYKNNGPVNTSDTAGPSSLNSRSGSHPVLGSPRL